MITMVIAWPILACICKHNNLFDAPVIIIATIVSIVLAIIFRYCFTTALESKCYGLSIIYYILYQIFSLAVFIKLAALVITFVCMIIIPFIFYNIPLSIASLFKKKEYTIQVIIPSGWGTTYEDKKVSKHEYLINKAEDLINDITYNLH